MGVHWLRGTTTMPSDTVLGYLADLLGESVEVRDGARHGYTTTYVVGVVQVWASDARPEVCVEVTGTACEVLGLERLAMLFWGLSLKVTRLDLAVDGCPFTPADVRAEWMRDRVRTVARQPNVKALEERGMQLRPEFEGVRSCSWHESATGSTFTMGSRQSAQFARVYDRRGFTRFELELKHRAAPIAALRVFEVVDDAPAFSEAVLGLVRGFVDFVDTEQDANVARAPLLAFWDAFCGMVARARVALGGTPERTLADAVAWFKHQVAPVYAVLLDALGPAALDDMAAGGRQRWRRRHSDMLPASLPGTA